jgi:hypothetical protein
MSAHLLRNAWVVSGIVCASVATTSRGDVIYRETFGRPDPATGNLSTNLFDWQRFNAAGTAGSQTTGVSSDSTGKPTDLANVNAGANSDGTFGAYAEGWSYQDGTQRLSMTPEFGFNPADYEAGSISFSWYQGAAQLTTPAVADQQGKLAVRVGGVWYASVENETNGAGVTGTTFAESAGTVLVSQTFNPAAANWLILNFDGNYDPATDVATASTVALSLGGNPASDLSGPITAFGIYRDATGQNFRFDTFQIDATPIPEPTALAGLLIGSVALLGRKRRGSA